MSSVWTDLTNKELVGLYGPFKEIDRRKEHALLKEGKFRHILSVISYEVPYDELGEDQPSDEDLVETGETKEDYYGTRYLITVGHHLVNVEVIFESTKPMPEGLEFTNFWFDDHIEAP